MGTFFETQCSLSSHLDNLQFTLWDRLKGKVKIHESRLADVGDSREHTFYHVILYQLHGLTEIAGLDIDGRVKKSISFESVLQC